LFRIVSDNIVHLHSEKWLCSFLYEILRTERNRLKPRTAMTVANFIVVKSCTVETLAR